MADTKKAAETASVISSVQNTQIKELAKLKNKKDRDASGLFLVEGAHMLQEAWSAGLLQTIYMLPDQKLPPDIPAAAAEIRLCTQNVLNKLSTQKSDARWIGVCRKPELHSFAESGLSRFLILDHIQDPGNAGSLIRSAYAFGVQGVLLSADCADLYAPKTLQSTQGALFHLPCWSTDLSKAIEILKSRNIPVFGAALHRNSIRLHDLPVPEDYGVLIGNEGQGIRPELLEQVDQTLFIEMQAFESLNAAIAGSIILYQFQFPEKNRQDHS